MSVLMNRRCSLGAAVTLDSRIEITLSNGHRLSVSGAFDPDAVSRLVRGLIS